MLIQSLAFMLDEEALDIPGARCEYIRVRSAAAVLAADGPVHIQCFFVATMCMNRHAYLAPDIFESNATLTGFYRSELNFNDGPPDNTPRD